MWQQISREWSDAELLVLTYHRVGNRAGNAPISEETFRAQISWLGSRCEFMDPDDLQGFLAGDKPTTTPTVLLTFDDGHRCLAETVCPVLREHGIRAIAFLATEAISGGLYLWPDEVRARILGNRAFEIDCLQAGSGDAISRLDQADRLIHKMKAVSDAERREILETLRSATTLSLERSPMISWADARSMADTFHWGGHTHAHPILSRLDADAARREICRGRDVIEAETGQDVIHFAYPNGRAGDFSDMTQRILRDEGFVSAFTTEPGYVAVTDDPMRLNRCPSSASSLRDFAWMTARPSWTN